MEHEFSDNVREQIQNLETSEAEKLKLRRANGLFVAVRDGIVNLVNEKFGKKDSTKSIDKLGESGLALLHQAAQPRCENEPSRRYRTRGKSRR